jgi:cell division protein FtsN
MSRTDYLTLGIVAVCILALAFLIYRMATIDSGPAASDATEQVMDESAPDPTMPEENTAGTEYGDETTAPNYSRDADEMDDEKVEAVDEMPAPKKEPAATKPAEKPADRAEPAPPAEEPAPAPAYSASGSYMVLAGSFREMVNAEAMVSKVKKLGYESASVEKFDRGAFAVALVDRFDSYAEANALVKELAKKGVEATVYKKK